MQLKTVEEIIESLELCECEHISGDLQTERVAHAITQDRQDTITAVIEMVEGMNKGEQMFDNNQVKLNRAYNQALTDIITKLQTLSPKE